MAYFSFGQSFNGLKIVRIKNTETDKTVGVTGSNYPEMYRYPASFLIPDDDPQSNKEGNTANGQYGYMLNSRTWIYDIGLSLLAFTISGDYDLCEEMLKRLALDQNPDGSWNFSYDIYIGKLFHDYVRTGSIGWLGWGMCYYILHSGKTEWIEMAKRGADYLLNLQVLDKDDIRFGLLRGGFGAYDDDYGYIEEEIEWCSTEHNCSSLQYMWGIYLLTGEPKYKECVNKMEYALRNTLYDSVNERFYQGVSTNEVDTAWALDCTTWAGMGSISFMDIMAGEKFMATTNEVFSVSDNVVKNDSALHYNMTYELETPVHGYMPYSEKTPDYAGCPKIVWTEGTLGAIALLLKLGKTNEAYFYIDEMIKLLDLGVGIGKRGNGGLIYTTQTWAELPWEFHVWESVVSTSWLYILLKDPNAIWSFHTKQSVTVSSVRDGESHGVVQRGKIIQVD